MTLQNFDTARFALPSYAMRLGESQVPVNRIKRNATKRKRFCRRFTLKRLSRVQAELENLRAIYESLIIEGNLIYENLRLTELLWRKSVLHGECVFDVRREYEFADSYRIWVRPVPIALKRIATFEACGQSIHGGKEFREHFSEASKILAGEDPFFADKAIEARWQRATEFMRPDPQPVQVDSSGHIFDQTGKEIVMPGLEPAKIVRALEDERLGRMYSLDEVVASLEQYEL
jgi:hypothetical protein